MEFIKQLKSNAKTTYFKKTRNEKKKDEMTDKTEDQLIDKLLECDFSKIIKK